MFKIEQFNFSNEAAVNQFNHFAALSLAIVSTYAYVDTILPACAVNFKMGSPDAYRERAEGPVLRCDLGAWRVRRDPCATNVSGPLPAAHRAGPVVHRDVLPPRTHGV